MHLKKRLLAAAAVIAMAAAVIYGSTREMNTEEEVVALSQYGDKETIYFWYSDDSLTNYINSAAVSFGEKEGVRVIPYLASGREYLETLNHATLHEKQAPDAYIISNDSLEKAYLAGLAGEVTDPQGICNAQFFPQAALSAVSYQGKTIGYPLFFETSVLVYNETYLKEWATQQAEKDQAEANASGEGEENSYLDDEQLAAQSMEYLENGLPSTVDDILGIANSYEAPEGVEVLKWDVSDIFFNYWIVGNYMIVGGDSGEDTGNLDIDNEETKKCLEVYKALNQFFYIEPDNVTYDSVIQDFIDGRIMFTIATTDVVKRLEEEKTQGSLPYDYGFVTMPDVSTELKSRSMSVTNAVVVNGYSEHRELANRFASYLVNDYADGLYERTGRVPSNLNADTGSDALQVFVQEYAESVPLPKMMETGNFWMHLEILFSKVWNGADVNALVEELAAQMVFQVESAPD